MRPRGQRYETLDGFASERDLVPWYWRLLAYGASFMILGGFLILPATFDNDPALRISQAVLGIFGAALLAAGVSISVLLCFAVRNPLFHAHSVLLPSLSSCAIGLLTIFYDFLISSRYVWNTPALLLTLTGSISTIVYAVLLVYTYRRIGPAKVPNRKAIRHSTHSGARPDSYTGAAHDGAFWQHPAFYENYNRNMYPTAARHPQPTDYDPSCITEEEMQRQQMLMLLLSREQPPTPDPSSTTFHIDWQAQDQDEQPLSAYPPTTHPPPHSATSRGWSTRDLRPWDGIWRGPPQRSRREFATSAQRRDASRQRREERRREIEMGS